MAPTDKILHLTRHAEAAHNVDQDYSIPDAQLTAQGCEQAAKLNSVTVQTIQQTADLLVTSPLSRALQTTILGFPALKARLESQKDSKPLIVLSQLQEVDGFPCDVGRHKEELQADPQFKGIDFSNLEIDWNGKQGDFSPANVKSRALWVRRWLRSRPEKEIVGESSMTIDPVDHICL
jgi:broad specificity phosphatase PhoE